MVQFNGHFDGRVITPDEQVELPINTPLRVIIVPARPVVEDWHAFIERTYGSCTGLGLEEPEDLPLQQRDWPA